MNDLQRLDLLLKFQEEKYLFKSDDIDVATSLWIVGKKCIHTPLCIGADCLHVEIRVFKDTFRYCSYIWRFKKPK